MNTPPPDSNGQPPIEYAQSLMAAGDWAAAAKIWWGIAQQAETGGASGGAIDRPTAAMAYSEHGRCCLESGQLEQAQSSLQIAKTIQPDFILAWRLLGWVAARRWDWQLAAEQWRAVLNTDLQPAEEAEALLAHISALAELKEFEEASAAIERLRKVSDEPYVIQAQRALLAEKKGDLKTAAATWLEIAQAKQKAKQDDPLAWTSHARFCLYLGEFGTAKQSLERVFALDSGFAPARQVLASIATEQRDWPLAVEQWRAVLAAGPTEAALPEVLYALIGALIELDEFSEAEPLLKRLGEVQVDPRNDLELRAAMSERQGEWDKAGKLWLDIALLSG